MRDILIVVALSWLFIIVNANEECWCSRGEHCHTPKAGEDVCRMCDPGTYMPDNYHNWRRCIPCTVIANATLEDLVAKCNRFHDAVIHCINGYYRDTKTNVCKRCTECEFTERECQIYSDTVCCNSKKEANITEAGTAVCKKKSILCQQGQFFNTSSGKCLPCSPEMFMPYQNHTYKECLPCAKLFKDNVNQVIEIRLCTRNATTLFGSQESYSIDPAHEYLETEAPCKPYWNCSLRLTACGKFHAVCDVEDPKAAIDAVTTTQLKEPDFTASPDAILDSCVRQCTKDLFETTKSSVAQSESSRRKCLKDCFSEIDNDNTIPAWVPVVLWIVLLVLLTVVNVFVFCLLEQSAACNFIIIRLNRSQFTWILIIFSVVNACLPGVNVLVEKTNTGHWKCSVTTMAFCYILFTIKLALVLIFMKNVGPENLRIKSLDKSKYAQTPQSLLRRTNHVLPLL